MRTKREIFEIVKAHLLAQGAPARLDGATCAYLAHDGKKCAVGCLIPFEAYSRALESDSFYDEVKGKDWPASGHYDIGPNVRNTAWEKVYEAVPELMAYGGMLRRLQELHDNSRPCDWAAGLNAIGIDEFGLDNQDVCGVDP